MMRDVSQSNDIALQDVKGTGDSVNITTTPSSSGTTNAPKFAPGKLDAFIKTYDGISLLVNVQAAPTALINSVGPALLTGGPRVLFWAPLIGWFLGTCLAGSLAEMASVEPYAGAQYIWTYTNAPKWWSERTRLMLSHVQAYITWFGWILSAALIPILMTGQIMELISIYHPSVTSWSLQRTGGIEVVIGVVAVLLGFGCMLNKYLRIILRPLEMAGVLLMVAIVLIIVVGLPANGKRNSAQFAFTSGTLDQAGTAWGNSGLAFCQGLALTFAMFTGTDSLIHMAAEVTNSDLRAPSIMFNSMQVCGLLALPLAIIIPLYMGPLREDVLSAAYPITQILLDQTQNIPLVSCFTCLIILQIFPSYCGILVTASRLTLQLAQQRGLPEWFCRFWRLRGPYGPLVFVCCLCIAMLFINVGSSVAIVIMFTFSTGFLCLSYAIVLGVRIIARIWDSDNLRLGKWSMGRWGLWANCIAGLASLFFVILQVLPLFEPIRAPSFPYLGPVIGFVMTLAIIDHLWRGKAFNPVANIRVAKEIVEEDMTAESYQIAAV